MAHEPHPIDVHVGKRVKFARLSKGLSQTDLAGAVGLTFQQIQKYEKGTNRISASRLYEFAGILERDVAFFFADADTGDRGQEAFAGMDFARVDLDLLRSLSNISDATIKRKLLALINCVSLNSGNGSFGS